MGTITATAIINKAQLVLFDINGVAWARTELLSWINDAQREIATAAPRAVSFTTPVAMVVGTRQSIPADGWSLVDVFRNMGANGTTPGAALRVVSKRHLDLFNGNWHAAAVTAAPTEFMYDPADPTRFWVNPPSDGTGQVEINYLKTPVDLAVEASAINLLDIFEPAILNYVLWRACSKRADYAPAAEAPKYRAAYEAALGTKAATEDATNPNASINRRPPPPGAES